MREPADRAAWMSRAFATRSVKERALPGAPGCMLAKVAREALGIQPPLQASLRGGLGESSHHGGMALLHLLPIFSFGYPFARAP